MESSEKEVKLKIYQKYQIIENIDKRENINISKILRIVNLSKSGYYKYLKEKEERIKKEENDFKIIKEIYLKYKGKFGYRRIAMELNMNHKKVHRLMKKFNLKSTIRKKRKSDISFRKMLKENIAPNHLNRQFKQETPYRFLSTDITYINYDKGNK